LAFDYNSDMSAIPEHKLAESPNSRSIDIHNWQITASTNPISNTAELDAFYDTLGIPLPEMTFGSNHLTLRHSPSNWEYTFRHPHVLSAVKKGELEEGDGGVKVGYADAWLRSRCASTRPRLG
jgi:type 2A phosphatase activator TIP41